VRSKTEAKVTIEAKSTKFLDYNFKFIGEILISLSRNILNALNAASARLGYISRRIFDKKSVRTFEYRIMLATVIRIRFANWNEYVGSFLHVNA